MSLSIAFSVRSLAAGIAAALLMALLAVPAAPARAAGQCDVSDTSLDVEERAFVSLINEYRAANGASQLTVSASLTRAAAWMATDLGGRSVFGHDDSLGRSAQTRIADCGYPGGAGENLAAGTAWDSAARAMQAWKESPHHNTNMLFSAYVQIGVARVNAPGSQYGWYWATTFGTDNDGSNLLASEDAGRRQASAVDPLAGVSPLWVNDASYGSRGEVFYWDPRSGGVWTGERGWHTFAPLLVRVTQPLWVNDLEYRSVGQGFYLDPLAKSVWTAECGWHSFRRAGC